MQTTLRQDNLFFNDFLHHKQSYGLSWINPLNAHDIWHNVLPSTYRLPFNTVVSIDGLKMKSMETVWINFHIKGYSISRFRHCIIITNRIILAFIKRNILISVTRTQMKTWNNHLSQYQTLLFIRFKQKNYRGVKNCTIKKKDANMHF